MPSIKTLSKYIRKKKKQLEKQTNKLIYSKELRDKIKAKEEIARLEKELLDLNQKLAYQKVMSDVQRDKSTKGTERVHDAVEVDTGCNQVGFGAPW
ncbi:MAG: hypothetical protein ABG776_22710 [Cyanobacteria bacterium J06555_13]